MTEPDYPCSWCGKHTSHQIVDCQHFEAPTLWRRWCSQQCRTAWLDQQHSTQHVDAEIGPLPPALPPVELSDAWGQS